jgi:hypothetical protein
MSLPDLVLAVGTHPEQPRAVVALNRRAAGRIEFLAAEPTYSPRMLGFGQLSKGFLLVAHIFKAVAAKHSFGFDGQSVCLCQRD